MTLITSKEYTIRYLDNSDAETLRQWLADPSLQRYFPCATQEEIAFIVRIWMSYSPYKCGLTALYKKQRVGMGVLYLSPYRKVAHHALLQIIVDPKMTQRGIGTSLVRNLMNLARRYFRLERLHAELYDDSPLVKILEKEGFKSIFEQANFIKEKEKQARRIVLERIL